MKALRLLSFFGMIFLFGACCSHDEQIVNYPDSPEIARYTYFGTDSWWQFQSTDGKVKRFTMGNFYRNFTTLYFECEKCGWPHCRSTTNPAYYRTDMNVHGPDTSYLNMYKSTYAETQYRLNYYAQGTNYSAGLNFFNTQGKGLKDSTLVLDVAGQSMDSIRLYTILYYSSTNIPGSGRYDSLSLYLAPNIGPVLIRLSNGQEWKLTDYHIVKPPLN